MKTYEELAVLDQGEDGAIVSIRGEAGPLVLLGPSYFGHLKSLLDRAQDTVSYMTPGGDFEPVAALYAEMRTLVRTYDEICNKFLGSAPSARTLAEISAETEQLRKELERL